MYLNEDIFKSIRKPTTSNYYQTKFQTSVHILTYGKFLGALIITWQETITKLNDSFDNTRQEINTKFSNLVNIVI